MKKIFAFLVMIALALGVGCGKGAKNSQSANNISEQTGKAAPLRVASLKGPTAMGIVKMMADNNNNSYEIFGTADEAATKLVKNEIDIALVPANLASVLYNKTGGNVQVAGINTLGVLYIVEKGDSVKSVADLKGKTILGTGKGTTPEYSLNYLLNKNGLDSNNDVTVDYKSEPTQVASELNAGKGTIAMLPQPYVATVLAKNKDIRIALDMTKEWDKVSQDSAMVTGVVLVRKEAAQNRKADIDAFLAEYKQSVDYINNNVDEGAKLVAEKGIAPEEAAKNAIPYCNIVLIEGEEMKTKLGGYLKVLFEQNPSSVGGKLPDEGIYYNK